jgi:hypothetical protein
MREMSGRVGSASLDPTYGLYGLMEFQTIRPYSEGPDIYGPWPIPIFFRKTPAAF